MTTEYDDIDQLHEFLKSIRTIEEFFERKKPGFRDWYMREMSKRMVEEGHVAEEHMLLALKQGEKRCFVTERNERLGKQRT
ncbi:MAG: hypothetical protein AAGA75_17330 [Cyanobacteria bacterium P01_E01_bin.6]